MDSCSAMPLSLQFCDERPFLKQFTSSSTIVCLACIFRNFLDFVFPILN
jgi:hypothetical protein